MRSDRSSFFGKFCGVVAIVVTIILVWTWLWLSRNLGASFPLLRGELVKGWLLAIPPAAVLVGALGWWLASLRNSAVKDLNRELRDRLDDPAKMRPIDPETFASEYRELTGNINKLIAIRSGGGDQLTRFSAKVAHELRAPVTLLQLQMDYAADKLDPEFRQSMSVQIKRLTDYINLALLVAKAEQGNIPVSKQRTRVDTVVRDLLDPYNLRAKSLGRTINVKLSSEREADFDVTIFGLIFHNLLSNAFAHGAGEIRLHLLDRISHSDLYILNRAKSDSATENSKETGTGLGLNTVKILTEAHGGMRFRESRRGNNFGVLWRIESSG
jgi:two-component system heavy metal sensor histidine kinase CusS